MMRSAQLAPLPRPDPDDAQHLRRLAVRVLAQAVTDLLHPRTAAGAAMFLLHDYWSPQCVWRAHTDRLLRPGPIRNFVLQRLEDVLADRVHAAGTRAKWPPGTRRRLQQVMAEARREAIGQAPPEER